MAVKFDMGTSTLDTLSKQTSTSSDDLAALVRQLLEAAEPLQGRFQGAGRAAFDEFKARVDGISAELKTSLDAVLAGVQGQSKAFTQGDMTMADNARTAQGASSFDSARFSGR